jgi:hypothetical protein
MFYFMHAYVYRSKTAGHTRGPRTVAGTASGVLRTETLAARARARVADAAQRQEEAEAYRLRYVYTPILLE